MLGLGCVRNHQVIYRIGSLETEESSEWAMSSVIYRIGSLEKQAYEEAKALKVIYRIGSLEIEESGSAG